MRLKNWPSALARFVESRRSSPFQWGENDCAMFAADAIKAITERNVARDYRGQYSTENEARAIIEKDGGLRAIASKYLGPEISPKYAQRGDVALIVDGAGQEALAVCLGASFAAPAKGGGLNFYKLDRIKAAWRVA